MLSKETRGMRFGVWATRQHIDMQIAYRAAYDVTHPMRAALLADFRHTVLQSWSLEALNDLGITPTRYVDDTHAFAFLPFGVTNDATWITHRRLMAGVTLPMLLERWGVAGRPARVAIFAGRLEGVTRGLRHMVSPSHPSPHAPISISVLPMYR